MKTDIVDYVSSCEDCRLSNTLKYRHGVVFGWECSITGNVVKNIDTYPFAEECPLSEDKPLIIHIFLKDL